MQSDGAVITDFFSGGLDGWRKKKLRQLQNFTFGPVTKTIGKKNSCGAHTGKVGFDKREISREVEEVMDHFEGKQTGPSMSPKSSLGKQIGTVFSTPAPPPSVLVIHLIWV